jgi:hypothetical protein
MPCSLTYFQCCLWRMCVTKLCKRFTIDRFQYWYHKLVVPPLIQAMNQTPGQLLFSVTLKPEKHPEQHTEKRIVATMLLSEGKRLLFHDSETVSPVLSDLS